MDQSVQEELAQTLARLPVQQLYAVLRFARSLEEHTVAPTIDATMVSEEVTERALVDFVAAAGCGQSGDPGAPYE